MTRVLAAVAVLVVLTSPADVRTSAIQTSSQQTTASPVLAIAPPAHPLPAEADSAGVTRLSFLAYGDTRGRRDGEALQYEHSLVVDSMLATIARQAKTDFPIRFVLQSGDAVVNGRDPAQWNVSFVSLINRLTQEGGVPYFLAPGNHDVTSAPSQDAPNRQAGLRNYLDATGKLIPPDGAARRLDGYPTFAFGYGNTFVMAIDSTIAGDDRQFEWVKAQFEGLDRGRYGHVIALFHHPLFSSGPHGGPVVEAAALAMRERYAPLFRQHHVRMTITGHDHLYDHFVERYEDAEGPHRLDHIVTGGGGAPLYGYAGEPSLTAYRQAGRPERVSVDHVMRPGPNPGDNPYHYVLIEVDGDRLRLQVIGVDWGVGYQPYRTNRIDLGGSGSTGVVIR